MTNRLPVIVGRLFLLGAAAYVLTGCIADTAEDTNLPWATNQSWEGIAPLGPSVVDRYQ